MANFSVKEEYEQDALIKEFGLESSNIIIVPGNHDLNWILAKKGYDLKDRDD